MSDSAPKSTIIIPESHQGLLTSPMPASMSTIRHTDGRISTNPVGFLWEEGVIRISTLKSRMKYKNLLANPNITLCCISPEDPIHYIELRGTATLEDDSDHEFLTRFYLANVGQEPPEDLDPPNSERVTITMQVEQVSCPHLYGGRFHK